jgi:hypothetical protein
MILFHKLIKPWGTQQRSWLRHNAISWKVAGSIPNVIGFFNSPTPSSRTMILGSTQPLKEMSARNLPGGKGRPARKADNLTAICEPIVYKVLEPRRLTTLWVSTACHRDSFTFTSWMRWRSPDSWATGLIQSRNSQSIITIHVILSEESVNKYLHCPY